MELVARVEEDPEERVAEPACDDLVERPARLADPERAVPFGDRLEVRPDEPVHVVADPGRQLARVLEDESRPTIERAPDPEGHGEPVAPLNRAVTGAEESEWRSGPGRQHEMTRQRRAAPLEQPDSFRLRHPGPEIEEEVADPAGRLAGGVLERRQLLGLVDD